MGKKKIFMYSTQTTLVEQESFTFYKLGFDVYTAAWAVNKTSHLHSILHHNPNHFYQGKCEFLTDEEVRIISKIDVHWQKFPTFPVIYEPEVERVLLERFDVLYVTAPTPWLVYAEAFLKAGKIVIFRPFGYHPNTWGNVDLESLFAYDRFFVCTCTPHDQPYYKRSHCIITMLNKELLTEIGTPNSGSGVFTVCPGMLPDIFNMVNEQMVRSGIVWNTHQYLVVPPWKTQVEMDMLYSRSLLGLDVNAAFKYPIIESIFHGKAVVAMGVNGTSPLYVYMNKTGISNNDFWYNSLTEDAINLVTKMHTDEEYRLRVFEAQSAWLAAMLKSGIETWCNILGVR